MSEEKNIQAAVEVTNKLFELDKMLSMENIIKDNQILFKIKEQEYRVRILTPLENEEVTQEKRKYYTKLIMDPTFKFKKDWVESYKEKGIDINSKESEITRIQAEINAIYLKLVETTEKNAIELMEKEIKELQQKIYVISSEIQELLGYSIETTMQIFSSEQMFIRELEKKENDSWVRVFATYEDYKKTEDASFLTETIYYHQILNLGV